MKEVCQVSKRFNKACDSISRLALYKIVGEFGFLLEFVRLIKMCQNVTYSRIRVATFFLTCFVLGMVRKMYMI